MIVVVTDGAWFGALPDADAYGDVGSDTLGHVAALVPLRVPTLRTLGLGRFVDLGTDARGAWGRMRERSPGKDSVTGHLEMAGVVLASAFPTFPEGVFSCHDS